VDELLGRAPLSGLRSEHPRFPWTRFLREVIEDFRAGEFGGVKADRTSVTALLAGRASQRFRELRDQGMRRVINGTGVILHTNLGRAIVGKSVRDAVLEAMYSYTSLEIDLESGKRSGRAEVLLDLIRLAAESEAAMVVNNNAAAVYLVIDSLSPPGRVLVSRGELVEIGGSFRLPDILSKAAAEVIEVGTTNRTYIADYAGCVREKDVLLKVHPSNYDIQGFTHETTIAELVDLAKHSGAYLVYDLGSGSFHDFASAGIEGEDRVSDVLRLGVDCVTMSGDKLLGGVQAGIIVGREAILGQLKRNPLRRALRVDKLTIAALQALFRTYLFTETPEAHVPALHQALGGIEDLEKRGREILSGLRSCDDRFTISLVEDEAALGGGSFAGEELPSWALRISCDSEKRAVELARRMRELPVPILSRIKGNEVRLNLRSILPDEDGELQNALLSLLRRRRSEG
jgi:L-seryl-tRNA(Ser) seleniumtransferase